MKKNLRKIFFLAVFFIIINIFQITSLAANTIIVLDPGHGGKDTGAINEKAGLIERDINLKVANYLKHYLSEYAGITVLLTHEGFSNGTYELIDRALWARRKSADLIVSLHCNSSESGKLNGTEAFVTANKSLPKYNEQCSELANKILNNISKLGIDNCGVKTKLSGDELELYSDGTRGDYYGIIRYAMKGIKDGPGVNIQNGEGISTVLVEHCYINGDDSKYLDSEEDIKKLAKADSDAIVEFYNLRLKSECVSSISLNKTNLKLMKNDKEQLEAKIMPETAVNKNIEWSSSNEEVATVDKQGIVTAIAKGEATITAKTEDGEYEDFCYVTVSEIEINEDEIYLLVEDKYEIKFNLENDELDFKIEDETIAKVDETGIITGLEEGKTKLIITNKNDKTFKKEIIINVSKLKENQEIKISDFKIENTNTLKLKEKLTKEELIEKFEISSDLEIQINNNEKEYITTDTSIEIIEIQTEKVIKKYYCIVSADISKDGIVDSMDMYQMIQHLLGNYQLEENSLKAADVSKDEKIDSMDMYLVIQYLLGNIEID